MTGAEHILAWAESDRRLYNALCDLERRRAPDARDCFLSPLGAFYAAQNIVAGSYQQATHCGDMNRDEITPEDFAQAVVAVLAWKKEP